MACALTLAGQSAAAQMANSPMYSSSSGTSPRERISLNADWRFHKYGSAEQADNLIYDVRPKVEDARDDRPADEKPTEAVKVETTQQVLKPWIPPAGNDFVKDPAKRHVRPEGNEGVGGSMGRLPSPGVAWYRKKLQIPATDAGKSLFLDVDGAMSYTTVWLNGRLVGGWPYGYSTWRVDLTN